MSQRNLGIGLILVGLLMIVTFNCLAADQSVPIDSSPAAVEEAYQAVRAGDAVSVATLKQTAEGLLVKLINSATTAADFLADEIPKVIKELLLWKSIYYAAKVLFGIGLGLAAWYLLQYIIHQHKKWKNKSTRPSDQYYDGEWWFLLFGVVPLAGASFWNLSYFWNFLQIMLAPRVWLIEYAASLVK
jgi:hypothetical protein